MSRILRHKTKSPSLPSPRRKKTGEKSSSAAAAVQLSSSDDDDSAGYEGVDDFSEDTESEPDAQVAAEHDFANELPSDNSGDEAQQQKPDEDGDVFDGFEFDDDEIPSDEIAEALAINEDEDDEDEDEDDDDDHFPGAALADFIMQDEWEQSLNNARKEVRWSIPSSSSSSSEEDDDSHGMTATLFPDIFQGESAVDPFHIPPLGARSGHGEIHSDGSETFWDYRGEELSSDPDAEVENDGDDEEDDEGSSVSGTSSGYESDDGETTDEDIPVVRPNPPRSILRRQSLDAEESAEEIPRARSKLPSQGKRLLPKLGTWITDANKPFAMIDSQGKKLVIYRNTIHRPTRSLGAEIPLIDESDFEAMPMESLRPHPGNMMFNTMHSSLSGNIGGQFGPPEAFYPFVHVASNGDINPEFVPRHFSDLSGDSDGDGDLEDVWNVEDMITFDSSSSEEDPTIVRDDDEESGNSPAFTDGPSSTPARRPSTRGEESASNLDMFTHFQTHVGAYRKMQDKHTMTSRNQVTPASLAFSNPTGQNVIRGIKGGRLAAANSPITPLRKSKTAKVDIFPSSPAAAVQEKKRKFTGETSGHKRSRSMV